jgi:hypothetical protein
MATAGTGAAGIAVARAAAAGTCREDTRQLMRPSMLLLHLQGRQLLGRQMQGRQLMGPRLQLLHLQRRQLLGRQLLGRQLLGRQLLGRQLLYPPVDPVSQEDILEPNPVRFSLLLLVEHVENRPDQTELLMILRYQDPE